MPSRESAVARTLTVESLFEGRPRRALLVLALVVAAACGTISPYNPVAYQNAVSLKVDSLNLLEKATTPYDGHKGEVESLQRELEKAYEYAKGLPKNEVSTKQWATLRDSSGALIGGVLRKWKVEGTLSETFVQEVGPLISKGFDQVIELETKKIRD
jgi:hypothetical protein